MTICKECKFQGFPLYCNSCKLQGKWQQRHWEKFWPKATELCEHCNKRAGKHAYDLGGCLDLKHPGLLFISKEARQHFKGKL
jgi:hypothetical protein